MKDLSRHVGFWVAACTLICGPPAFAQPLQSAQLTEMVRRSGPDQRAGGADRFWKEVARSGTPLMESLGNDRGKTLVTFLWRDANPAADIRIYGDFISKQDKAGTPLENVRGTDIWQRSFVIRDGARFRYYFTSPRRAEPEPTAIFSAEVEGVVYEAFRDPLNHRTFPVQDVREVDVVSYAEGAHAPPEPYLARRPSTPRGKIDTFEISSQLLGNRRSVSIYTPAAYGSGPAPYPMLILLDGQEYQISVPTPTILDNMTADRAIPPMVAVLIDNIDDETRTRELPPRNNLFDRFLAEELLPWVRARYRVTHDPAATVIAGSSFGGLAALNAAMAHPDLFGKVIALSGAFGWAPGDPRERGEPPLLGPDCCRTLQQVATDPRHAIKIHLGVGTWEDTDILLTNRLLRDLLRVKGYPVTYREYEGGHDYVNWRSELPEGLIALSGRTGGQRK